MTSPVNLRQVMQEQESAKELFDWAHQRLVRGAPAYELTASLLDQGWAEELAQYFVEQVRQAAAPRRRRKAVWVALTGIAWLAGGLGAIAAGHEIAGTWSIQGPLLIGWVVVACGLLRAVAGLVDLLRWRRADAAPAARRRALRSASHRRLRAAHGWSAKRMGSGLEALDFRTLGLDGASSADVAHQAYREMAKAWHPDRFHGAADIRERVERRMRLLNAAYDRIKARSAD